jgi:hypothetical protein
MPQEEHDPRKDSVDIGEMIRSLGEALAEPFNDPELKEKAMAFGKSMAKSAESFQNKFSDVEIKARLRDMGAAAQAFSRNIADSFKDDAESKKHFTVEEAKQIGEELGIDWSKFDIEQYRMGIDVELEHGKVDPHTDVTSDDPIMTGKIALAHLNEFPDYYTRLKKMEEEAEGKL